MANCQYNMRYARRPMTNTLPPPRSAAASWKAARIPRITSRKICLSQWLTCHGRSGKISMNHVKHWSAEHSSENWINRFSGKGADTDEQHEQQRAQRNEPDRLP